MTESLEELMGAYADGDEKAFEALHAILAPRLLGFFRRGGLNHERASELVQLTFLRLHTARGRYRRGEPVRPWVFVIASNLLTDERRRRGRALVFNFEDGAEERLPAPEPDPGLPAELSEALQRALDALPMQQREVILLHKYEGLPLKQVADITGCTLAAVKVRAFRGYEALRRAMGGGRR